ncbi:enoyl-CoA hydratase/isomerase family protein [Sinomonas notoginsengisoli]|uniref:enoyl-CoA hydratase/isomerase family protein n=1 Tax=Sinomonas notoginsengisoli TaxID=1457311 RepID=UPI001F19BFC5|nr:enoyl-CoA hydratase/isomerase family protein [Sinomonas notoginsengisoli]
MTTQAAPIGAGPGIRPSGEGSLRVEAAGAVAVITIDNPAKRNALTQEMWRQFGPILEQLDTDDRVKVVVFRGAGRTFSAGADISALERILHDPSTGQRDGGDITRAEEAIAAFRKPTIAAIEGYCVGGAWQIAGACDIRVAAEGAVFGVTPSKIGIVYPLSGIERLVRLVGPATAKYLLFSGDFVEAVDAARLGMASWVAPDDGFWAEVHDFAERIASRSQFSVQAHKDLVDTISAGGDVAGRSGFWQEQMAAGPDSAIGIRAFLAKERPAFTWAAPVEG